MNLLGTSLRTPHSALRNLSVLVAPNPFKGTYSAREAAQEIAKGVRRVWPKVRLTILPLADGGSGTLDALSKISGSRWHRCHIQGPFGETIQAKWMERPGKVAVVECAQAVGWVQAGRRRDPMRASSHGVGEMIRRAAYEGMKRLIVGLGDTVTVDGGLGMLEALGLTFAGADGLPVGRGGAELEKVSSITISDEFWSVRRQFSGVEVWCDVMARLTGPGGAARGFGPQKGASPAMVRRLERGLVHWGKILERATGKRASGLPGSGAAGGTGAALAAWFGGELNSGGEETLKALRAEALVRRADLVVTGEGRLDRQSVMGKASWRLAAWASRMAKPCVYVTGSSRLSQRAIPKGVRVVLLDERPLVEAVAKAFSGL